VGSPVKRIWISTSLKFSSEHGFTHSCTHAHLKMTLQA